MRKAAERELNDLPCWNASPFADDERLALQRHVAMFGNLRRPELHLSDLLGHDADLAERQRHRLFDGPPPAGDWQRVPELHPRASRRKRTGDDNPLTGDGGLLGRAFEKTGADGSRGQVE